MIISFPIMIASYKLLLWLEFHLIAHLELQSRLLLLLWCLVNGLHISFIWGLDFILLSILSFTHSFHCYSCSLLKVFMYVSVMAWIPLYYTSWTSFTTSMLWHLSFLLWPSSLLLMALICFHYDLNLHLLHPSVEVLLGSPMFRDA